MDYSAFGLPYDIATSHLPTKLIAEPPGKVADLDAEHQTAARTSILILTIHRCRGMSWRFKPGWLSVCRPSQSSPPRVPVSYPSAERAAPNGFGRHMFAPQTP